MLHICRCVSVRETRENQPQCSSLILSKVIGKKNAFDFIRPRMPRRRDHGVKPIYGSSRVAWRESILIHVGWFPSYVRNKKHFKIFPLPYNGLVRKLTWPEVTEIKIPRYTFCRYWCPYQLLKVSCWSTENYSHIAIANSFGGWVT